MSAITANPIRRIVTGHDARGKAVVCEDGPLRTVVELTSVPGTWFHEIWSTEGSPANIDNGLDPTTSALKLSPPALGTRLRVVDIPPETSAAAEADSERARGAFDQIGESSAATGIVGGPHPLMHRTQTVDYGVVLEGEIILILDDSEIELRSGDIVVQRGTNHAWANRSGRPCRMLFMLIDGSYGASLRAALDR